jgi:hypothetical protein
MRGSGPQVSCGPFSILYLHYKLSKMIFAAPNTVVSA